LAARFGSVSLTGPAAFDHYLFLGGTGSGKSTFLRMLMASVLNEPPTLPPAAFVYDPKREFLPVLEGLGRAQDCVVLNPMDRRCAAWDLSADFRDPVAVRQLAAILTEEPDRGSDENRFFRNAVQDILSAVMSTFIALAREEAAWTLRDVVLGCIYPAYLDAILAHTRDPYGRLLLPNIRVKQVYFQDADPRTKSNIKASVQAALAIYEPIAAVWDWAQSRPADQWPRVFSVTRWLEEGLVLVLGNDEGARASLDPINRAIFQRAVEKTLSEPARPSPGAIGRTWFFLDEVREAGKLTLLPRLLNKARAHSASVVLAFQDIEGLKEEYGEHVALELVAQCNNKVVLRVDSPSTAEWAASLFGEFLGPEMSFGKNVGPQYSESTHWAKAVRQNVYTSQVLFLQRAGPQNGIPGFYKHGEQDPDQPQLAHLAEWATDVAPYLPPASNTAPYQPHASPDVFSLRPFDSKDWERLGLDGQPPNLMNS
jgi:type IV secretory pathway TraG/TraD family ATPase VirD4